jgi:MFS family permease
MSDALMPKAQAIRVFLAFALAYFLSTLVRAVTATLSPVLTTEFSLNAADLGLLAGGYFFGFSLTQLPLGSWLDRYGPKRMLLWFLAVAVLGCGAFAVALDFNGLLLARVMCGVGLSACLMAPLTGYRRWYAKDMLIRANSWMLMSGSLGVVASTLPVQWLLPHLGWRGVFGVLGVLLVLAMVVIIRVVPRWQVSAPVVQDAPTKASYAQVWRDPYFQKMAPLAFFAYGGLIAVQTLWAAPWMIKVNGYTPLQAASGLFALNVTLLMAYWWWGWSNPRLTARGWTTVKLITVCVPASLALLGLTIISAQQSLVPTTVILVMYCVVCTVVSLAQPSVGMAFPAALAGRALSAYNLVIFSGIFAMQWGIGLVVDTLRKLGWSEVAAFQGAFTVLLLLSAASYIYFLRKKA